MTTAQTATSGLTMPPKGGRRVSLVDDHLEVSAVLTTVEDVEKLINALNAYKLLVQPVHGAFDTDYPAPPRKPPAPADYSDEVTEEQVEHIKSLVPQTEFEDAEEVCPAAW